MNCMACSIDGKCTACLGPRIPSKDGKTCVSDCSTIDADCIACSDGKCTTCFGVK